MQRQIHILPDDRILQVSHGTLLLDALRRAGIAVDAPCGGNGTCGKCRVLVNGAWEQACRFAVEQDITVELPSLFINDTTQTAGAVHTICYTACFLFG